ncbi:hypothetical protein M422DRAFT_29503 [Sphaerobolus stellatus SS14]|uniref:Uncharacterized protein n=1 Tax=Sphaerobolus stellatus (strain SS14) TaxID=990650 RepID=A0A0C9VFK8_SPHS4|nr:hypothetical protein M422DRAFT_29503 [Sphaerobolus stellatus SS14]
MPAQNTPTRSLKGIEIIQQSSQSRTKTYKYLIPKECGHNYVYIDPIQGIHMDSPQAKLKLQSEDNLQITDCKGDYPTHAKGKNEPGFLPVMSNKDRTLHDDDRLVFGWPSSSSVEFIVKLLYETTAPKGSKNIPSGSSTKQKEVPSIQVQKSPPFEKMDILSSAPKLRKSRSAEVQNEKELLKPPPSDVKSSRRKSEGHFDEKLKTQLRESKEPKEHHTPTIMTTVLPQQIEISNESSSSMKLGDGYNALTHSFTGNCALASCFPISKKNPAVDVDFDIFLLNSTSSILSKEEVGFGMGSKITSDIKLGAKYDELVSMRWDVSKVFVKYTGRGTYDWDSIKYSTLSRHVDISKPRFWTEYGDYYISDIQRCFGWCVVMVFHVESLEDINQVQTDIEARVREVFTIKAQGGTKLLKDKGWSMYRMFCNCYGFSPDILKYSAGLSTLSEVFQFLEKINKITPPGVTHRARLTRYLNAPDLTIPSHAYNELKKLHETSATLFDRTFNPVIRRNPTLFKELETIYSKFRSDSGNYFERNRRGDSEQYQAQREKAKKDLRDAVSKADTAIQRSGLIFEAQRLMKQGHVTGTSQRKGKIWNWKCGMTGTLKKSSTIASGAGYSVVSGRFTPQGPNYSMSTKDVYMASWNFTNVKRNWPFSSNTEAVFRYDSEQKRADYSQDTNMSQFVLGGELVYVIGWAVKCEYVDETGKPPKGSEGQSLKVWIDPQTNGQNDTFLSDYFRIRIRSTDRIKCTLQVFFVHQKVYRLNSQ